MRWSPLMPKALPSGPLQKVGCPRCSFHNGFAVPMKSERYCKAQANRRFEKPQADGWASVGYDKSHQAHS